MAGDEIILLLLVLCRCQIPFYPQFLLFLRLVNVHLPILIQKGFLICNLEIVWDGICRRGKADNCELPRQVSRRKQYSQTPFWAVLNWISASIIHSCFLGIMYYAYAYVTPGLHTYFSDISIVSTSMSIRKWKLFLFSYAYAYVAV